MIIKGRMYIVGRLFITQKDVDLYYSLWEIDIKHLHLILYAGTVPVPNFIVNPVPEPEWLREWEAEDRQKIVQSINRLRKAGLIKIRKSRLWLKMEAIYLLALWLEYSPAQEAKRCLKQKGITPLKHRIQWGQMENLWWRGEKLKSLPQKWLDHSLLCLP